MRLVAALKILVGLYGPVDKSKPLLDISESLLDMNEIECARCGWNWIMFEGQTEADCPFCPANAGEPTFVTSRESESPEM